MLYGLQIASLNLPRNTEPTRDSYPVEEIVTDPRLGTLALPSGRQGRGSPEEHLGVVGRLLRDWGQPEAKQKEEPPNHTEEILPTLQATEEAAQNPALSVPVPSYPRSIPPLLSSVGSAVGR